MATTTNYGWDTPDDTDLVKDGAAAIRTLGNSVDTTTKALNPETTLGDIAYRSATSNTNTRLAIGSAGQVLTVAAGVPSWASPSDQTPLTTKGDVFTFSTVDARLGVGANGTVLTADSAETTGLKWAAPAAAGGFTLLSTTTLSSSSTTISSISGSHKHLLVILKGITSTTEGDQVNFRFNSDTGNNYYKGGIRYIGTSASGSAGLGAASDSLQILDRVQSGSVVGEFGSAAVYLYRYTDTDFIDGYAQASGHDNTNGVIQALSLRYDCSAAISSLTVFGVGTLGGTVYIYGVN